MSSRNSSESWQSSSPGSMDHPCMGRRTPAFEAPKVVSDSNGADVDSGERSADRSRCLLQLFVEDVSLVRRLVVPPIPLPRRNGLAALERHATHVAVRSVDVDCPAGRTTCFSHALHSRGSPVSAGWTSMPRTPVSRTIICFKERADEWTAGHDRGCVSTAPTIQGHLRVSNPLRATSPAGR